MQKPILAALAVIALSAAAASSPRAALAGSIADFYDGKNITVVVGFGAGGTYGKYSQMLARYLRPHVPGKPNIVIQHMPGAGGIKATNYAYNVLPKNGTGLIMPPDSLVISELLRPNKVKYKSNRFTWLGTVIQSNSVVVVRADAGVRTLADVRSKQVIMASSGKGSQTFLMPSLTNSLYATKFKIVMGYKGSRKMMLSMEQGETQGVSLTWLAWKSNKPDWFEGAKPFARPLVQIGYTKETDLPNVPMLVDLVKSKQDKDIVNFMATLAPIGRGLAFPPGVPQRFVTALRKAFDAAVRDPTFRKDAESRRLRVNPLTGEQVQKIVNDVLKVPPETVKRARKLIMG